MNQPMGIWDIASLVPFEVPICMVGPGATHGATDWLLWWKIADSKINIYIILHPIHFNTQTFFGGYAIFEGNPSSSNQPWCESKWNSELQACWPELVCRLLQHIESAALRHLGWGTADPTSQRGRSMSFPRFFQLIGRVQKLHLGRNSAHM